MHDPEIDGFGLPVGVNHQQLLPRFGRRQFIIRGASGVASFTAVGTLLAACGGNDSKSGGTPSVVGTPPKVPTGTVTVAIPGGPTSLDPARRLGVGAFFTTEDLYDSLVTWTNDFSKVVGQLVESWRVSPDAKEWIGRIRQGATFHDGTPVDATAIKTNFQYFLKNSAYLFVPLPLREIDDSKPDVIRFIWKSPYVYATQNLTLLKIQSPKAIAAGPKKIDKAPVGSGPFSFVSADSNIVELRRFPDYWAPGKPYLERLRFVVIQDAGARLTALQSGQVNVVTGLSPAQAAQVETYPRTQAVSRPSWFVTTLSFKLTAPPVDNLMLRQAIAYAIDREAILKSVGRGQGKVADSLMPPGIDGYQPASPSYNYDPQKAKALVRQIGRQPTLRIAIGAGDSLGNFLGGEDSGQAIAGQLKAVGIDVRVDAITEAEDNQRRTKLRPAQPAALSGGTWFTGGPIIFDFVEPDINMKEAYPKEYARLAKLLQEKDSEADDTKRHEIIGQIQQIHMRLVTYIPLFVFPIVDGVSKDVQGYVPDKRNFGPNFDSVFLAKT